MELKARDLELRYEREHGRKPKLNAEGKIEHEIIKTKTKGAFQGNLYKHAVHLGDDS